MTAHRAPIIPHSTFRNPPSEHSAFLTRDNSAFSTSADLRRTLPIDLSRASIDTAARTIEVSFSSDTPLLRWGDTEILSHAPGACDLSRLNSGAIVLFNHNRDDYIGNVADGTARIEPDGKGRATLRFSENPLAEKIFADIRSGILRQVSVGYTVQEWQINQAADPKSPSTYTAIRWQPHEISIVTVAADTTVGVGRDKPQTKTTIHHTTMNRAQLISALQARGIAFNTDATDDQLRELLERSPAEGARSNKPATATPTPAPATAPAADAAERAKAGPAITDRQNVTDILDLAEAYARTCPDAHKLAHEAIRQQHDITKFQRTLLDALNKGHRDTAATMRESATIGLSEKDSRKFSFRKFILAAVAGNGERHLVDDAKFELEVAETAASRLRASGREVRGLVIPHDVLENSGRRDIISAKTGTGYTGTTGNLVETTLMVGSFMELLRARCIFLANTTPLGNLTGAISIPKQTSHASSGWLGEDDEAPDTAVTFGQVSLAHKTVAAYTQITRDMLKQPSMDVENFVRSELARAQAFAIDTAGYYGTGATAQPLGLKNVSGISAFAFPGGKLTYEGLVEMEGAIAASNADIGAMLYLINTSVRAKAKTIKKFAASGTDATIWEPGDTINGYKTDISNQILDTDIFFGVWSEIIHAMWGGLEILTDQKVRTGRIEISAFQDINFLCRRPECFCLGDLTEPAPTP